MSNDVIVEPFPIFPRRYFDASPTWFAWNKLTAADVHSLREERGFEGQDVYFYLNHPIQFVRLVGIVSGIESVANGKFTLVTLDDSSGANIEFKIKQRLVLPSDTAQYPSNTEVDNLDVSASLGLVRVLIDGRPIELGTVIRAQGTITKFRNTRQVILKRIWRVKDTNEEVVYWSKTAEWKRTVLANPWVLTEEDRLKIDLDAQRRENAERQAIEQRRRLKVEVAKKKQRHLEKREARRQMQESEMNAGALEGSGVLRMPWD